MWWGAAGQAEIAVCSSPQPPGPPQRLGRALPTPEPRKGWGSPGRKTGPASCSVAGNPRKWPLPGHQAFKKAKTDCPEPAAPCAKVWEAWAPGHGVGGASVAGPGPARRGEGQATRSMPANREVTCSGLVSACPMSPGTVVGTGLLGEMGAGLRGCRKAWSTAGGTAAVSRSVELSGAVVVAGPGQAGGSGAGGRCPQEASRCLRICKRKQKWGWQCGHGALCLLPCG